MIVVHDYKLFNTKLIDSFLMFIDVNQVSNHRIHFTVSKAIKTDGLTFKTLILI